MGRPRTTASAPSLVRTRGGIRQPPSRPRSASTGLSAEAVGQLCSSESDVGLEELQQRQHSSERMRHGSPTDSGPVLSSIDLTVPADIALQGDHMATFVLVPGAWLGAWAWDETARALRERGHTAVAVTLTGVADRAGLGGPQTDL